MGVLKQPHAFQAAPSPTELSRHLSASTSRTQTYLYPNACNASSVTGPIRAIRFYSQMKELQPPLSADPVPTSVT